MNKVYRVVVNGNEYEVEVEEIGGGTTSSSATNSEPVVEKSNPTSKPAPRPTPKKRPVKKQRQQPAVSGAGSITAPMSGTILEVKVAEGDSVSSGDLLLVLEAMKMENEIYAPGDGTVASVNVSANDKVDSGSVLIEIE